MKRNRFKLVSKGDHKFVALVDTIDNTTIDMAWNSTEPGFNNLLFLHENLNYENTVYRSELEKYAKDYPDYHQMRINF